MRQVWWLILSSSLALVSQIMKQIAQDRKKAMLFDTMHAELPVLGMVLRKIAVARFTRTLGTLITSGVPILEGLAITARTSGNAVLEASADESAQGHGRRPHHRRSAERKRRVPEHGDADDRRR